jgi:hypothetical protein
MKKKGAGKAGFSIHHQGISPELQDEMMNSPPNIPWTLYRPSRNPGEKNKKILFFQLFHACFFTVFSRFSPYGSRS